MKWIAALALITASAAAEGKVFEGCGVRFEYPDRWTATFDPSGIYDYRLPARCVVGLRPPGWLRYRKESPFVLAPYPVAVRLIDRPFLKVAREAGFLRLEDFKNYPDAARRAPEGWAINVRQGTEPAHPFRTDRFQGVRGQTWGNGRGKNGGRTTETADIAILNDRRGHSVLIDAWDDTMFREALDRVIRTFRLAAR